MKGAAAVEARARDFWLSCATMRDWLNEPLAADELCQHSDQHGRQTWEQLWSKEWSFYVAIARQVGKHVDRLVRKQEAT